MKRILIVLIIMVISPAVVFAEAAEDRPHWSVEIKGGTFIPALDDWSQNYGRRNTTEFGGSIAYKVWRPLEVGLEGEAIQDTGQGFAPLHNKAAGKVTYQLFPLNAFILARGIFTEEQWVVPYVGGGWTRMFYDEKIENQGTARGTVDGYHARAGLQFLLDGIDASASNSFYLEYGVFHTYLFLEAEYTRAMAETVSGGSVNLGGTSWLGGLLIEF